MYAQLFHVLSRCLGLPRPARLQGGAHGAGGQRGGAAVLLLHPGDVSPLPGLPGQPAGAAHDGNPASQTQVALLHTHTHTHTETF